MDGWMDGLTQRIGLFFLCSNRLTTSQIEPLSVFKTTARRKKKNNNPQTTPVPLNVNVRFFISFSSGVLQGQRSPFTARSGDGGVSAQVSMPAEASSTYRDLPAAPHKRPDPVI